MGVDIVDAVLNTYRKLPKRAHPGVRPNGSLEWSILAGFVIEYNGIFECVAIGIGVKCLSAIKIPLQGDVSHWLANENPFDTRRWYMTVTLKYSPKGLLFAIC
ncbi:hypothetical protein E3Q10_02272 [Wallemia mellicola]|uniref:Uncharacterized protein n=1 Tax=Wallemia mellicola TaxID=1708541 RepID=A0A4T0R604_9BASI|nr:hypothetical protein E3Q14_02429 [Wallemia mellicola]TIC12435.1 hypothetical protein E3Q15_02288 [Wallemia mellicola]TIC27404.1 hypothetical protein E3Q11_02450 [Wallemia mellicola]TIC30117.1 hypothetical protein E3Q10_02272 [Wallemia mellicola]